MKRELKRETDREKIHTRLGDRIRRKNCIIM